MEPLSASRNLVVALFAALATAPTGLAAGAAVILADTGTTSSRLTAELSAQALLGQGYTATRVSLPSAIAADAALVAGTIDAYTTETATLLERVLARPAVRDDATLTTMLVAELSARGQTPVALTPADDAPQVACRRAAIRSHRLSGLVTLGRSAGRLTYAATPAHVVRADGIAALRVRFRRVVVAADAKRFDLIAARRVHCVLSSTAEPRAARLSLVALRDRTRRLAGTPRHGLVVTGQAYLAGAPATFAPTLERVAASVTTDALRSLIGQVELDGQDPVTVAQAFLRANGVVQ